MKLPNSELAIVDREKIVDYLLNPTHPDNGGKAKFFADLGFNRENWTVLASALQRFAQETEVLQKLENEHGIKYVLSGHLKFDAYRSANVTAIWIIDQGKQAPRLVTAYKDRRRQ